MHCRQKALAILKCFFFSLLLSSVVSFLSEGFLNLHVALIHKHIKIPHTLTLYMLYLAGNLTYPPKSELSLFRGWGPRQRCAWAISSCTNRGISENRKRKHPSTWAGISCAYPLYFWGILEGRKKKCEDWLLKRCDITKTKWHVSETLCWLEVVQEKIEGGKQFPSIN